MTAPLLVVVGRVGRAHGVRGDVTVEVRTDEPDRRFASGARLLTSGGADDLPESVTVQAARWHRGRLLLHLADIDDRTAAEALRGVLLQVAVDPADAPADPEEFYDHQLIGLVVLDSDDRSLGRVSGVVHGAQDLLVIDLDPQDADAHPQQSLVPFVTALVPVVDLVGGFLRVDLPGGLLELGEG